MNNKVTFSSRAKALLLLYCACAFFSIFATIDTGEHYRAWRTARTWTEEQRKVAPALDAERMHVLILMAIAVDTAIIALSFTGALILGMAVATENPGTYSLSKAMGWTAGGLGCAFSVMMLAYRFLVYNRVLLKGPIFDYHLNIQIPIALALIGFPVSLLAYSFYLAKHPSRS